MADEGKRKKTEEEESIAVPVEAGTAEPVAEDMKQQDEPSSTTAALAAGVTEAGDDGNQAPAQTIAAAPKGDEEEEGSDFEDLDDVLDDFSTSKKPTSAAPSSSKNAPSLSTTAPQPPPSSLLPDQNATRAPESDLDENAFIQQLEQSMAELMGSATAGGQGGGGGDGDGEPDWDALAQQMAQGDMDPAAIMKLLMGEGGPGALAGGSEADLGGGNKDGKGQGDAKSGSTAAGTAGSSSASKAEDGFQETIRKTMERMQASGDKATAAATEDGGDDMLMQLLKAMESGAGAGGAGGGDDENLDKIFMGIMEQLSNKEMLYEPMKELHAKFGPWLLENRDKVPKEDLERYELQSVLVAEIVGKFDEEGYSDEKPADRAYIWEKMQKMQAAGSPPDALVSNPLADELGLPGAFAGGGGDAETPQCPQQ
ncbi:peroxisomal membrane protein receptor Pex19, variant [Blastomyces dermatitidis ER-3]|uniref:Peroxisomal membrane protein receptor Pex19 n=2 Tax=Ajellomyces dermatitidis TaxID=5039 RepID=F2T9I2_AJEDA|nr:peroxisomal membrane protein receptor Pex19 [Blastomyces dermatitidis ER-3]XP_045279335.1 peroxisomal membrane protein receptor Pex19, variant [Blastomyces dermatitidis ER-3]EGE79895.1 peroxisomal membrane protein receptor Pex19 [Blastomyces dermatitidis ATCC 18188]EEQ84073.1 peroxisomal membrane protein receptor Pex19 [Blastomyces dermatitidis ER-3]KMW67134.1 peroxisomal membrane protein receptor Pex19, variant [Blastomyces dermatitidis ATCC 18188]OAS99607.1 peroxisomal membrane protein re